MKFKLELLKYQKIVDNELDNFLSSKIDQKANSFITLSSKLMHEYVLRGGKRLRAIATIKAYESFTGKKEKKIFIPAIGLELFHASSLIHDDIMDEDDTRRNKPSMHKEYNDWFLSKFKENLHHGPIFNSESLRFSTSSAIIQGNILFSWGLFCFSNSDFKDNLRVKSLNLSQEAYRVVNEGQLLDILNESDKFVSKEDYIHMAALKTGKLFSTALEIGAIFADAPDKVRQLFHDFGMNIAIAFQIQDDIMDISEGMKKGNTLGSDIRKGKMTLLLINALSNANKVQKSYLSKVCGKTDATKSEIKKVVDIFEKTGSISQTKSLAEFYITKGKENLLELKNYITPAGFSFFNSLADYMTKRII